ncbi:hypothetical protein CHS0354_010303 [Potamilus streckersoni]|uniref:Protein crumbs n=1 Tax=Potamilus streckersoni TaxID=2493646 RepID=A0AAE0TBY4_9BIVA|nr:hypothetical protein CHS0354_010303 [Potamilus streckersoni]
MAIFIDSVGNPRSRARALVHQLEIVLLFLLAGLVTCDTGQKYGFFNRSENSYVRLVSTSWNLQKLTGFSFRTCSGGEILSQNGTSGDFLQLEITNGTLKFQSLVQTASLTVSIGQNLNNNAWYTVNLHYYLGNLFLNISQGNTQVKSEIIANSTYRTYLFNVNLSNNLGLNVGQGYTGCLLEGPNVIFVNNALIVNNVSWSNTSCQKNENNCPTDTVNTNVCYSQPCRNGGTCHDNSGNYTCECPHLFNGTNCENDLSVYGCAMRPCLNNGNCINITSGTKLYQCYCQPGFTGTNCEAIINECGSNPCQNRGQCIDGINSYTCNCTGTGYRGSRCEQDIDECIAGMKPCGLGTCFNIPGSAFCFCPDGFNGEPCQDINECQSNPCQNGATCTDQVNNFTCMCVAGFTGHRCDININDCINVMCPYSNTRCRDLVNSYVCECKSGFTGLPTNCTDINECASSPCRNNATCQNLENAYRCLCQAGFTDSNCSTNINDCLPNPCMNNATCQDGINNYTCTCQPGYTGKNCSVDIDECSSRPCKNGGVCRDLVNDFSCNCTPGWTGKMCDADINECASNPCQHGSICVNGQNMYRCSCTPGYNGTNCETDINECLSNPCLNNGTCIDRVNGFNCTCQPQWMGETCIEPYDACSPRFMNCKNGGTCSTSPLSHNFSCTCLPGYTDNDCRTDVDDCASSPCTPPLQCYDKVNSYSCACPIGLTGDNCTDEIYECESNPCENNGTCLDKRGHYNCSCQQSNFTVNYGTFNKTFISGFQGYNCEQDIDECSYQPAICQNGGRCENKNGTFYCLCGPDGSGNYYLGAYCELTASYCQVADDVKNDLPACKNGGTCQNIDKGYRCTCAPGYTDKRCSTDINECLSNPCQYNGSCKDLVNGYNCTCIPGITGVHCETNIDECASNPCQNGGSCTDHINGYTCNCTDTGFKGDNCQININDCESLPCVNGANCTDHVKDFSCSCYQGYEGKTCSIDIDECASNPCQYNGTCLQKSNTTLYDNKHPGFGNFSFANAFGYICQCIPGITGANCEVNIDDCQNSSCSNGATCVDYINRYECRCVPGYRGQFCEVEINECTEYQACKFGSNCTDLVNDYRCTCPLLYQGKPYGGKNCTFEFTICAVNECKSGSTCRPFLVDEASGQQNYTCACVNGFTGRFCNISTTVSFNNGSHIYIKKEVNDQQDITEFSFRFRTTLVDSLLIAWLGLHPSGLFLTIELKNSNLFIGYAINGINDLKNESIPLTFNNANWHTVHVVEDITKKSISVKVTSILCRSENECTLNTNYSTDSLQHIYFGSMGIDSKVLKNTLSKAQFIGCMQDIWIGDTLLESQTNTTIILIRLQTSFINLALNCPRQEQCIPDPCHGQGVCIDLWNSFKCNCKRPFLGSTCANEYTAATFALGNMTSYATFTLPETQKQGLLTRVDLSFFLRSRTRNGLIVTLGSPVKSTFISLELYNGHLRSRLSYCNYSKSYDAKDNTIYSDGSQHIVYFDLQPGVFNYTVDDVQITDNSLPLNCNFSSEKLYFGGNVTTSRKKRESVAMDPVSIGNFTGVPNYKGTIQDVQLNGYSLLFFPQNDSTITPLPVINVTAQSMVMPGELDEDVCIRDHPCENNATCHRVFYEDFRCDCLPAYRGKNCSELNFCWLGTCPNGATCRSLDDGFECASNATFNGQSSYASYRNTLSATRQINDFSFNFRTVVRNGFILAIEKLPYFYRVGIFRSKIYLDYNVNGSTMQIQSDLAIQDGKEYMVKVTETENDIRLEVSRTDNTNINSTKIELITFRLFNLSEIVHSSQNIIRIGPQGGNWDGSNLFKGCLSDVRIDNILLPFFNDNEIVNNTSKEKFMLNSSKDLQIGCHGNNSPCQYSQCKNGASCGEDFVDYNCSCQKGYSGRWCEININDCGQSNPCNSGQCVDGVDMFYCRCPKTYTGIRCETDINECMNNPCLNNGTCVNLNGSYECVCSNGFTGQKCNISLNRNCSAYLCQNGATCRPVNITINGTKYSTFNCSCSAGYEGDTCSEVTDYCQSFPCQNGGNCTSSPINHTFTCQCAAGYSGRYCEMDINDCNSTPCFNGGNCTDTVNGFICVCPSGWTGMNCNVDTNECNTNPCQNRARCVNSMGSFSCDCTSTGYKGPDCADDVNECLQIPCQNGGSCTNSIGDYNCSCTYGYTGKNCDQPNCTSVNCNNGTCKVVNNKWVCDCLEYYEGDQCGIKGPCLNKPCYEPNTNKCIQYTVNNTYWCNCKPGWIRNCSEDYDECAHSTSPCLNGICVNLPGKYRCNCSIGYEGELCNLDVNECLQSPCKNGGYCINNIGSFFCNCSGTGYTNITCMDDIDECSVGTGPCQHEGSCINTNGSYYCKCSREYSGPNCETAIAQVADAELNQWVIIGPVVAGVLILIIIGVVLFLISARNKRATRGAYSPSRQELSGSRVELGHVLKRPPEERLI